MEKGHTFVIEQKKHDKTGKDIWVAKLTGKVDSDTFAQIKDKIVSLGGYYSRFVHAFVFSKDPVDLLKDFQIDKQEDSINELYIVKILKEAQIPFNRKLTKWGSTYWEIKGIHYRISDHDKPNGENFNGLDFRSLKEFYNHLKSRKDLDLSDKSLTEKKFKEKVIKNAKKQKVNLGNDDLQEYYVTPDGSMFDDLDNYANYLWQRELKEPSVADKKLDLKKLYDTRKSPRKDIIIREIQAGKMEYAVFKSFDGMTDSYDYHQVNSDSFVPAEGYKMLIDRLENAKGQSHWVYSASVDHNDNLGYYINFDSFYIRYKSAPSQSVEKPETPKSENKPTSIQEVSKAYFPKIPADIQNEFLFGGMSQKQAVWAWFSLQPYADVTNSILHTYDAGISNKGNPVIRLNLVNDVIKDFQAKKFLAGFSGIYFNMRDPLSILDFPERISFSPEYLVKGKSYRNLFTAYINRDKNAIFVFEEGKEFAGGYSLLYTSDLAFFESTIEKLILESSKIYSADIFDNQVPIIETDTVIDFLKTSIPEKTTDQTKSPEEIQSRLVILAKELAAQYNVSAEFAGDQLTAGQKVEFEHTSDADQALTIAHDHLSKESIQYYIALAKVEETFKQQDPDPEQQPVEKIEDRTYRVFTIFADETEKFYVDNLTYNEAEKIYNQQIAQINAEIITWDKEIIVDGKVTGHKTIQMVINKPSEEDIKLAKPASKTEDKTNDRIRRMLSEKGLKRHLYTREDFLLLSQYTGDTKSQGEKSDGYLWDYYTPDEAVKFCWQLAYKYGFRASESRRILEPSCGAGRFLRYAPDYCQVTSYELDETAWMISKLLYPKFNIIHDSFESHFYIKAGLKNFNYRPVYDTFHLVIGNPPYMYPYTSVYKEKEKAVYPFIASLEQLFLIRGIDSLEKNGLLIYIVPSSIVDNENSYLDFKEQLGKKANLIDMYRLPSGTFSNTDVTTDIVVLQKK